MLSLFPALLFALAIAATKATATDAFAEAVKPHRRLRGRFLHITDMHPDQHYLFGASMSSYCHRHRPRKQHVRAGYFGTPFRSVASRWRRPNPFMKNNLNNILIAYRGLWYSECDSPWTLTNLTLDYLEKEWAHNIDFVICTSPLYSYFLITLDTKLTRRTQGLETTRGKLGSWVARLRNPSISGNGA